MQIPDRTIAPLKKDIQKIVLPDVENLHLDNGIPVGLINLGTQEIIKLEIIFNAGRPFERKKLISRATGKLLKEGTKSQTAKEIAETIDFYGGTLSTPVNLDTANLTLYSLKKHYEKLLVVLADILNEPIFPQAEIDSFIQNSKHQLSIDLSKNEVIAYRKITEFIFGKNHPYGYNSDAKTYEAINRDDIVQHFQKTYTRKNCSIFISGKVDTQTIEITNKHLGNLLPAGEKMLPSFEETNNVPGLVKIEKPNKVQTAIRIGRKLFTRKHPDYKGLNILTTILGGYFGSRLMGNIREDKGYTYHIFASIDNMLHDGYLNIGTEVGNDFGNATMDEIFKELKKLREEPVEEEELKMVRNYLMGNILNALDGPFNVADVIKSLALEGLTREDFYENIQTIQNIRPSELQELANKYFDEENMWKVVVGS